MKLFQFVALASFVIASANGSFLDRDDFVSNMESAIKRDERESRITGKLMELAKPIENYDSNEPRFLEEYQNFAINITQFALRYIGCQNVHQYSDELAAEDDATTVLGMNRFVVVRLCPKYECSNYHAYGCNAGYGDFLIPMEEYLQTMAEDYFQQYQEYCETCYYCTHQDYVAAGDDAVNAAAGDDAVNNGQNDYYDDDGNGNVQQYGDDAMNNANDDAVNNANGNDDAVNNANNDDANNAQNDGNGGRRLQYSSSYQSNDDYYYMNADFYNNMDNNNNNQGDICANIGDACESYRTACKDYSQFATDMEAFFECGAFNIGNNVAYVGPHCRSDGKTIGIGLYKDQYCNEYNSNTQDLSSIIGMDLGDENLKAYYSDKCVSCLASDGFELGQDEADEVTPICGSLYDMGAKCNLYMGNDGEINSDAQEESEDGVCTFIHNIMTNAYDEYGEIFLEAEGWMAYVPDVREMTDFQRYALSASILLCVGLLAYSCYLHRTISNAKYSWHPKGRRSRDIHPGAAVPLGRMHSGIIQGRSRSNMEMRDGAVFA